MTGAPPVDAPPVDVVCLGESMVTFLPSRPGRLADAPSFARTIGGAESNVACALAAAGHRVKWVSRVGADGFGDHLVEAIGAYGVDVSAVGRDAVRPTGIYFRTATDRATAGHEVAYYRAGSAASAMSPATVPYDSVGDGRVLHLSGITAALSDDCLALMRSLTAPRAGRPVVSFDVNFRAGLWRDAAVGGRVLLELARGASVVFVGEDEAEEAWGVRGAAAVRAALPEPQVLVVKRGAAGAVVFERRAEQGTPPPDPGAERGTPPPDPRAERGAPLPDPGAERGAPLPDPGAERGTPPPDPGAEHDGGAGFGRRAAVSGGAGFGPPAAGSGGGGFDRRAAHPGGAGLDSRAAGPVETGRDTVTTVPAPLVDVVAPVGAGDAFAAGFLSATLRGLGATARIRHGHLMAAAALTVPGDLGAPARTAHADRLVALDDEGWGRLHLGPGWTGEDQEVRTP
ncbi:PfkB family carbohydrate kinase [Streptomyces sp. NPDC046316]|uniref:PfkB family carbohydrate kinase n=1 Tax=Streptomyces sp. NPDC046316 TaxID=3154494 RepID=UPI00340CB83F